MTLCNSRGQGELVNHRMIHVRDASTDCWHSNAITAETLLLVSCSYLQGDDKVDRCGRGSWWLVTLKVGDTLQCGFIACLQTRGGYTGS